MDLAPPNAESFLGYCLANRYKFVEILGKGGMGYIFVAKDLELPRTVAVKMIRPEFTKDRVIRRRVERECAMHASVGMHPNIITLHDKIIEDKKIFLIMEHAEGRTLANILKAQREDKNKISFNQSIQIVTQLLAALNIIHNNNIVHRDIKPSNIIVVPSEKQNSNFNVKLIDFGIARSESDDPNETRLTAFDSSGPGTPAYMAPERIDQKSFGDFSPATDLYSVGIIFYELIHTQPPFLGNLTEIFTAHITQQPDIKILEIPQSFKKIIAQSLNKAPKDRFVTVADFKCAIDAAIENPDVGSTVVKKESNERDGVTLLTTPAMHVSPGFTRKNEKSFLKFPNLRNKPIMVSYGLVIATVFIVALIYNLSLNNETVAALTDDPPVAITETSVVLSSDSPAKVSNKNDSNNDLTEDPEVESSPPLPEIYPGYFPPQDPFNRLTNPSPYVGTYNGQSRGRAEGSVNEAIGSQKAHTTSKKNTNNTSVKMSSSSSFKIRKRGTRPISPQ